MHAVQPCFNKVEKDSTPSVFCVITRLDPVIHPFTKTLAKGDGYAGQARV